jgi:hypothetical protein
LSGSTKSALAAPPSPVCTYADTAGSYDKTGFSLWRVDFKYPEELTQTFMSNNQIGGFFNRLEASRKYLFGSVGVLGTPNNSLISGVFILRGQEAVPVVNVAPDWESYEFTKLDIAKEADKAFFEAALAWDLEIDGKKWADGKNVRLSVFPLLPEPALTWHSPPVQVIEPRTPAVLIYFPFAYLRSRCRC